MVNIQFVKFLGECQRHRPRASPAPHRRDGIRVRPPAIIVCRDGCRGEEDMAVPHAQGEAHDAATTPRSLRDPESVRHRLRSSGGGTESGRAVPSPCHAVEDNHGHPSRYYILLLLPTFAFLDVNCWGSFILGRHWGRLL